MLVMCKRFLAFACIDESDGAVVPDGERDEELVVDMGVFKTDVLNVLIVVGMTCEW
jgi:hypothetical protein